MGGRDGGVPAAGDSDARDARDARDAGGGDRGAGADPAGVAGAEWVVDPARDDLPRRVDLRQRDADVLVSAGAAFGPGEGVLHGVCVGAPDTRSPRYVESAAGSLMRKVGGAVVFPSASAFATVLAGNDVRTRPVGVVADGTVARFAWVGPEVAVTTTADPFTPGDGGDAGVRLGRVDVHGAASTVRSLDRDLGRAADALD